MSKKRLSIHFQEDSGPQPSILDATSVRSIYFVAGTETVHRHNQHTTDIAQTLSIEAVENSS